MKQSVSQRIRESANEDRAVLLAMAASNADIAKQALALGNVAMARKNLIKAIEAIDLAADQDPKHANTQLIEV